MKNTAKKSNKTEQLGKRVTAALVTAAKAAKPENPKRDWALKRVTVLDARLGKDVGATRERARLSKIIDAS